MAPSTSEATPNPFFGVGPDVGGGPYIIGCWWW
jgi:hypothetical protein